MLGSATVPDASTKTTVTIAQIGTTGGSVYVSVTSKGKLESDRTPAGYFAEAKTTAPKEENITIVNNAGISDTLEVTGLSAGDTVNVYDADQGRKSLGTATVSTYSSKATVSITQLGSTREMYMSRLPVRATRWKVIGLRLIIVAEPKSEHWISGNITIVNNAGVPGTVTVKGLVDNDVINVYDSASNGNVLGFAAVPQYSTQVVVTIPQLGSTGGSVYVTVTGKGKNESDRTKADYSAKPKSDSPTAGSVTIVNNVGIPDTVTVVGLAVSDIVNVYDCAEGGNQLGSATVSANGSQVVISISQLSTTAGSVYVTVTNKGKTESDREKVDFAPEQSSKAPVTGNITVVNNAGMSGTVTVTGLLINDVVKVYDTAEKGNLLGTATLSNGSSQAVVTVPQLGTSEGSLYVSVTSIGKTESTNDRSRLFSCIQCAC